MWRCTLTSIFGLFILYVTHVSGVPLRLFYPFGSEVRDYVLPQGDDVSSNEFPLNVSIAYLDNYFKTIYINSNGHLSFDTELPDYRASLILPIGFNIIAAFFADVDTRTAGKVFFRETKDSSLLQRAATDIQAHFKGQSSFSPTSLFIVTWDNVGSYKSSSDNVNTFQIVIASDSYDSFAFFHYLDEGITWLMGEGKEAPNLLDVPAQAGFDSEDGRNIKLPNSGTTCTFVNDTNVNIPGAWMFRIGNTEKNVQPADLNTGEVVVFPVGPGESSCLDGTRQCHINARCIDFPDGFCCECLPPFYGNGKNCLEPGVPQRLNGKVRGRVNEMTLDGLDMHTYVVTSDGRAYSAISRVPRELGNVMQTLNGVGGIIGWMFALPHTPKSKNGYSFTGGEFNRTATVTFYYGNETYVLTVRQSFFGHDALNNLRMDTILDGSIPPIDPGAKVTVDDHKDNFKKVGAGRITSRSSRTYRVDDVAYRYIWEQTIVYKDCMADPDVEAEDTIRLSVGRIFVFYDSGNQVVRYAQSNRVGMLTGKDPCRDAAQTCAADADCIPEGETYKCACKTGFYGDGSTCEDIDECGRNPCSENARCFNVRGSYQCQCYPGFRGDGRTCQREAQPCGDITCGEHARCVFDNRQQKPVCECVSGFGGDGVDCRPIEFGCNEVDNCGPNAECVYDEDEGRYRCECQDGFSGDGFSCETTDERSVCLRCDQNAQCVMDVDRLLYRCQCNVGYSGDGFSCHALDPCVKCSPNAECRFDQTTQEYRCLCRPGYYGNGIQCEVYDCFEYNVCDQNAECVQDPESELNICVCKTGYRGDGRRCVVSECRGDVDCGANARCTPVSPEDPRMMCRCAEGYEGDGRVCRQRIVPCNQVNNCAREAECIHDPDAESYRCQCRPEYTGDGYRCTRRTDIIDCQRDPRLCDSNARCVQNVDQYVCVCNQDYVGDGRSCRPFDITGSYLIYAQGYSLSKVPLPGNAATSGEMIVNVPGQLAVGVDTECSEGWLYWTDVAGGFINRARLDGSGIQTVVSGLVSPEGVAVDPISKNMYYTDSELDVIGVAKLDGTSKKTLFSADITNPRSIVLDPRRGLFYWTDWNREKPQIEKANMDGTGRLVLVNTDLGLPNGLTLDERTQQLCWGDAGTKRIECMRADGLGRRILNDNVPYPFDLTFFNNAIYWSDWERKSIPNINREGGPQLNNDVNLALGGNGRLYGITTVKDQCPRVTNACSVSNGGCRYLCLPTPSGGRSCACPDDIDPRRCNEVAVVKKRK